MTIDFSLHGFLLLIAIGAMLCLGWQAMSAVWSWVTTQGLSAAVLGVLLLLIVLVLLAVGV